MEGFDESLYHQNRIRDPIHGFIHFSDTEKKIIGLKEFQRLRNISLKYPKSLGTCLKSFMLSGYMPKITLCRIRTWFA